ncbi:probable protein phosphatase 2C 6 [Vigna unguiculata]|uniref:protein-serine/threonine phosphatase n=1 Tax=Vigna unguiculata TaxID=3917 RepID=A0A4D6L9L4_VIGUN|nr:probable protein phosphatase 2C 6 [Vigna unguiculata]QCD85238.1 protein phosphatase 2C [Vigna unguiculata]
MEEDDPLERLDSEFASTSSGSVISSTLSTEDFRNLNSSGDISSISSGSGEIPPAAVTEAILSPPPLHRAGLSDCEAPAVREKCIGRSNKGVSWGHTSVIGRRKEMEDAVAVIPGFMSRTCDHVGGCTAPGSRSSGEISPVHFFGVYDGHGGSQVAKFCAKRMHDVIAEEWNREMAGGAEWQRRWETVFANSFERTDNEILSDAVAPEMVGSTASVVVLSGCQIIASNCGDSRVVLCRRTQTIPLSVDQKPDRQDELLRIEGEGGKVINWNGARVFGVLAMSRAIGDRYLRPWIIPVPEITFTARTDEDECLILASDGLWDVMSNEEVGEVARHILRRRRRSLSVEEPSPAQVVADSLTEIAYGRNSKDNISIIVVDLKSKRKRQQRPPLIS